MKEKPRAKEKLTREELEKLFMMADWALDALMHQPRTKEDKTTLVRCFAALHFYFVRLTLQALDDRELAEQLVPFFEDANKRAVAYTDALGALADVLRFRHKIKGELFMPSEDQIKAAAEYVMKGIPFEEMKESHDRCRKADEERCLKALGRVREDHGNIMYL